MEIAREEALHYCKNVLGWKHACIPSKVIRDKFGLYNENAVYEYEPQDFFDTPRTFQFTLEPRVLLSSFIRPPQGFCDFHLRHLRKACEVEAGKEVEEHPQVYAIQILFQRQGLIDSADTTGLSVFFMPAVYIDAS
jgi:hypothetical protein